MRRSRFILGVLLMWMAGPMVGSAQVGELVRFHASPRRPVIQSAARKEAASKKASSKSADDQAVQLASMESDFDSSDVAPPEPDDAEYREARRASRKRTRPKRKVPPRQEVESDWDDEEEAEDEYDEPAARDEDDEPTTRSGRKLPAIPASVTLRQDQVLETEDALPEQPAPLVECGPADHHSVHVCRHSLCCGERLWVRADYLMWWTDGQTVPPLVTSSPSAVDIDQVGILGLPTTTVLYGGGGIGDSLRSGGRLRFGYWMDCRQCIGLTGSLWGLGNDDEDFAASSQGNPALARPFFNVNPDVLAEDSQIVSYPDVVAGRVAIDTDSEIYSGNLLLKGALGCTNDPNCDRSRRVSVLGGYRFFRFNEGLTITENLVSTNPGGVIQQGTTFDVTDRFQTANEFHGGEFGLSIEAQRNIWTVELLGTVALGYLSRRTTIDGSTVTTVPDELPNTVPGGLLTQVSNIGRYEDAEFTALPEFQLNLGCQLTQSVKANIGYTILVVGDVLRAGEQIDRSVNGLYLDPTQQFQGAERPRFSAKSSDLWITGLSFGLEWNF